jgi:hypothetical protein
MLEMEELYKPEIVIMDLHLIDEGDTLPDVVGSRVIAISTSSNKDGVPKAKEIRAKIFMASGALSLFFPLDDELFHTYSSYARGTERTGCWT